MSGVNIKDFVVPIIVGAGFLVMLSACDASKHHEIIGTKDFKEPTREAMREHDAPSRARKPKAESPLSPVTPYTVEELMAEEPMAEEYMAEEPMAEEYMAEEPMAEEPMSREPMSREPFSETDFPPDSMEEEKTGVMGSGAMSSGTMESSEDDTAQSMVPFDSMESRAHREEMASAAVTDMEQGEPSVELSNVYFAFDKYVIDNEAARVLRANVRMLENEYRNSNVLIEGHCDERGTVDYNLELGKRRAQAIKDYMVDLGVQESRLNIVSYGKEKPFCTVSRPDCWAKNRRGLLLLQKP